MSQASFKKSSNTTTPTWRRLLTDTRVRRALLPAGACAVVLTLTAALWPTHDAIPVTHDVQPVPPAETVQNDVVAERASNEAASTPEQQQTAQLPSPAAPQPAAAFSWKNQSVRNGDNLTTIFKRVSLGPADVHRLMTSSPLARPLTKMKPGEELRFAFADNGSLAQLQYIKSKLESYVYKAAPQDGKGSYVAEHVIREPEITTAYREATIDDSLFLAGERAKLPHNLIMEIANIFGWDVDFALDIRKGDHFALLYEEEFLDGEKIGTGNILAAEFTNRGRTFKAVRYVDSNGKASYYTPEGLSMRKAFLRAPLDFTRVSSSFNLKRLHPVFKTVRPHRGIDYAAQRGTPVYAAGDGKVIASGYSKANGNYVFIQHGQRYTTKYLHLHKRAVKKGKFVKQRQVIGTVGSTGYATGPHLHYEFLVNGVHQNPRTVSLPQALPIDDAERREFDTATAALINELALHQQSTQLAMLTEEQSEQHTTQ